MEVLTRPTAREFADRHKDLGHQEFSEWIFSFNMDLREWAELKEDFHHEFPEIESDNQPLKIISTIVQSISKKDFQTLKKRIEAELKPLSLTDRIALLENAIAENKNRKIEELQRLNLYHGDSLLDFHVTDFDGSLREPYYYLVRESNHLQNLFESCKYDEFVEATPIVKRIVDSLHDFEFSEWCERVVQEEPEYKLPYYIKIKTAVEIYANDLKKRDPKRNYWDVTRKCRYDKVMRMTLGPMNNYNDFIAWLDKQVNLYASEKPLLSKKVMFVNVKNIELSEQVIKSHLDPDVNEFDVTTEHNPSCKTLKKEGKLCPDCSTEALAYKIKGLQYAKRKKWLDYQVNLRTNKEQFLDELEGLLSDCEKFFNSSDYGLTSHFHGLIEDKRSSLQADDGNDSTTRIRLPISALSDFLKTKTANDLPKLKWNGTDTDLLELIVALTESRKIVNEKGESVRKEILEFFQKGLNHEIKDAEGKIRFAKNRKKELTPFLNSLVKAFEDYEAKFHKK